MPIIEIIKKYNEEKKEDSNCGICCLDGYCLDADINCYENEYFAFKNRKKKLTKYEFEIVEENDE